MKEVKQIYLQPSEPKPDFLDLFWLQVFQRVALKFFNLLGWRLHSCRLSLGVRLRDFGLSSPASLPSPALEPQSGGERVCLSLSACAPPSATPKSWLKAGPEGRRPRTQVLPGGSCGNQPCSWANAKGRNCAPDLGENTSDLFGFFFFFFSNKAKEANSLAAEGLQGGKGRTEWGGEAARREKVRRGDRGGG